MKGKSIVLNRERDVTLTPYTVPGSKPPAILILPGGGYNNCDESEGLPVAKSFNDRGCSVFILRYSVGKHRQWPNPLEDFDQGMAYLIGHAAEFDIDPRYIVAAGFSAGGHVAATAASLAKHKPYAAILCYGLTSRETLDFCAPDAPDACDVVNENTCPCFLASSRTDWIVPIGNTTKFIDALQRSYIDYEAHIYGYALHGFSVGEAAGAVGPLFCSRVGNWVEDSLQWLDELISGRYRSIRECAAWQDTHAQALSTLNSCQRVEACADAMKLLRRKFPIQALLYTAAKAKIGDFMNTVSLRNLFELAKVSDETISKMDAALSAFPNEDILHG